MWAYLGLKAGFGLIKIFNVFADDLRLPEIDVFHMSRNCFPHSSLLMQRIM